MFSASLHAFCVKPSLFTSRNHANLKVGVPRAFPGVPRAFPERQADSKPALRVFFSLFSVFFVRKPALFSSKNYANLKIGVPRRSRKTCQTKVWRSQGVPRTFPSVSRPREKKGRLRRDAALANVPSEKIKLCRTKVRRTQDVPRPS